MPEHESPSSTHPSEIEALIARLEDGHLSVEDRRLIQHLLRLLFTLIWDVEQKNISISRLKRLLFGPGSDRRPARTGVPTPVPGQGAPPAGNQAAKTTLPPSSP